MSDPAIGSNAIVTVDFETSWNVPKASSMAGRTLAVLSNSMTGTQEMLDNPNMQGDFNPSDATSGKKAAAGALGFVPNATMLPFFTRWLTGTLVESTMGTDTITHGGTPGSTTYKYVIVAKNAAGSVIAVGAEATTATGNATLSGSDTNISTWAAVVGAATYDVYRTSSAGTPSTTGKIGTATAPTVTFTDTGIAGNSAATPAKTHSVLTSKLGSTPPLGAILETDFLVGASHKYALAQGCRINRLSFPIAASGFLQVTADLMAADVTVGDTPYDSSYTDWTAGTPLEFLQLAAADVCLDGSPVGYIVGGNVDISANLYADDYRVGGLGARGSLIPQRHSIGGSLRICLDDVAIMAMLAAGAAHSISLVWTASATTKFALTLPRVIFQKTQPTLANSGPVIVDCQFRASKDPTTATALQFTITNDQTAAYYA